jgi:hypothetical protein
MKRMHPLFTAEISIKRGYILVECILHQTPAGKTTFYGRGV